MIAPGVASWLVEALAASTVLMLLVLLLRGTVRRAFGPDIAYALWALPVLRLLMPPLPAGWRDSAAVPIGAASQTITIYVTEPLAGSAIAPAAFPVAAFVAGLWIAGALAFLAWHGIAHVRFCRRMLAHRIRGSEVAGGIHLIETAAASGPLAFGVVRRYVAFPRDFVERYDRDERDLALAHELGHHARGDLIANWIALAVLALHWFNPIAWRAFRAFRADQEIANDARVLAGLSAVARHSYACAIVKSAHGGAVSAACHLHTVHDLKGRLKMLTTTRTSRARRLGGTVATATLALAGLGLTASGTQAAASMRDRVETAVTTLAVSAPAAAALPTPPQATELPAPPAPPVPPAPVPGDVSRTTTRVDGREVTSITIRRKDGTTDTRTLPSSDTLPAIPQIAKTECANATTQRPVVITEEKDGKRRIVMCMKRIDMAGTSAAAQIKVFEPGPATIGSRMRMALMGLDMARTTILNNAEMDAGSRAEALKGIEDALSEVRKQIKDTD